VGELDGRIPLDRQRIVAAGIDLADADGLGSLSMRQLAHELGFEVMSLYNHVAAKGELLGLMVDEVAGEIPLPEGAAPLTAIRDLAIRTREVYLRHPWAPTLWLRHAPGPNRRVLMETQLRLFAESGLSSEVAHHGFHAVGNHVLGTTLHEVAAETAMGADPDGVARDMIAALPADEFPYSIAHLRRHRDGGTSSSFEWVLDLILDGLVRLDAAGDE
jgi:AcrR family transcriptional regulator